jgi:hypothetical protein
MFQPMISPPIFTKSDHENESSGDSGDSGGFVYSFDKPAKYDKNRDSFWLLFWSDNAIL